MRNPMLLAMLCAALPLAAQDNPAPTQQDQLAQEQTKPAAPALEKPGMATPEPEKNVLDKKVPEKKKPVEAANAKVVEEIIARVNNEVITKSDLAKARVSAEDDARQECQGKCRPEQLRTDI